MFGDSAVTATALNDDNDLLISILPFGSSIEQMVEDLKNL
jgi:hypothetical protein